jgi:hypothetical protein
MCKGAVYRGKDKIQPRGLECVRVDFLVREHVIYSRLYIASRIPNEPERDNQRGRVPKSMLYDYMDPTWP